MSVIDQRGRRAPISTCCTTSACAPGAPARTPAASTTTRRCSAASTWARTSCCPRGSVSSPSTTGASAATSSARSTRARSRPRARPAGGPPLRTTRRSRALAVDTGRRAAGAAAPTGDRPRRGRGTPPRTRAHRPVHAPPGRRRRPPADGADAPQHGRRWRSRSAPRRSSANERAIGFYRRLGFVPLMDVGDALFMGRDPGSRPRELGTERSLDTHR